MVTSPDFIIAGGHKCASTSLYHALAAHPGIKMSHIKEPHYFVRRLLKDRLHTGVWVPEEYRQLWDQCDGITLRGEASVLYLYFADECVASLTNECIGSPKVIVSIRNPVDRAFSSYWDARLKDPNETAQTFEQAIEREIARGPWRLDGDTAPSLRHLALGIYSNGIQSFRRAFGPQNVHVLLFDDLMSDPTRTLAQVEAFLGLPHVDQPGALSRSNSGRLDWRDGVVASIARSRFSTGLRRGIKRAWPAAHSLSVRLALEKFAVPAPGMEQYIRELLSELYEPELRRLEATLGRSLQIWYKAA